jgi:hypothetical protein
VNAREYLDRAERLLAEAEGAAPGSQFLSQTLSALAMANAMVAALMLVVAVVEGRER